LRAAAVLSGLSLGSPNPAGLDANDRNKSDGRLWLKLRPEDQPAEGVLVCWGVTLEGRKILLGLALGSRES
jgi:hypothetical protein